MSFYANLTSIFFFLTLGILIIYNTVKTSEPISIWLVIGIMLITSTLTDFVWFYNGYIHPLDGNFLLSVFAIPNFFILLISAIYFKNYYKKRNVLQLTLDFSFILFIVFFIIFELYLDPFITGSANIELLMASSFFLLVSGLTLILMSSMIFTAKYEKLGLPYFLIITGIYIFSFVTLYFIYLYMRESYVYDGWLDVVYLLSISFFTLSYAFFKTGKTYETVVNYGEFSNFTSKKILAVFYFLMLLVLILLDILTIGPFVIVSLITIIYLYANIQVHKARMSELELIQEKENNQRLEEEVGKRTHELKDAYDHLKYQASHDSLTGLYNRETFLKYTCQHIKKGNQPFSILYMDLDRFKVINDIHGHTMGDRVLKKMADLFSAFIEDEITPIATSFIGRIGGDEFAILINTTDYDTLIHLAESIIDALKEPIIIDNFQFSLGISLGISRYPDDAKTVEELIRYADLAMYHAKEATSSQSKYLFYTSHLIEHIERRNNIELLLRNADYDQQFSINYQPQFDIHSKNLIGMEALMRWEHPIYGYISPAEFIPIAEEIGLIIEISNWVFKKVFQQIYQWNTNYHQNLTVGINVSPLSLDYVDFLPSLDQWLIDYNVNPEWIDLEITEHSAMNFSILMDELFTTLSNRGFHVSIDDFGTGYSSLSYLKQFNVDRLKIAKELIDHIVTDPNERLIVNAIIKMAEGLGLKTIAEGVETFEQLTILSSLHCHEIQGYVLGKPVSPSDFELLYLKK